MVHAKCRYALGDANGAYEILMKLYNRGRDWSLEALNLFGVLLRKFGKVQAPRFQCYQAGRSSSSPRDEKLHYNLALCFLALGQLADGKSLARGKPSCSPLSTPKSGSEARGKCAAPPKKGGRSTVPVLMRTGTVERPPRPLLSQER